MGDSGPTLASSLDLLRLVAERWERSPDRDADLICRVGPHIGCSVLKLQKRAWSNDSLVDMSNQTGLFFSIWTSDRGLRRGVAEYNLHAMSLRLLRGHRIKGTAFAAVFRRAFDDRRVDWPNVRTDFGPATLFEGHFPFRPEAFADDAWQLVTRFARVVPVIDRLLVERAKR